MDAASAILSPLLPSHLGLLTPCHLLSAPLVRNEDVRRLLQNFGVQVTAAEVGAVYARVQRECPELLGGAGPALYGILGEATFISPAVIPHARSARYH